MATAVIPLNFRFARPRGLNLEPPPIHAAPPSRPTVRAKFLWLGDRKLYIRGV